MLNNSPYISIISRVSYTIKWLYFKMRLQNVQSCTISGYLRATTENNKPKSSPAVSDYAIKIKISPTQHVCKPFDRHILSTLSLSQSYNFCLKGQNPHSSYEYRITLTFSKT